MIEPLALDTQVTHAAVQLQRNSIAEYMESSNPPREIALEGWRRRNALLDALFYDVGKVTPAEARDIAPWLAREGALLRVPPSGDGPLTRYEDADDLHARGGSELSVLAVAGVGSSALGAAAFARNVADALDRPVLALVSGYGLSDLVTEALGGWFWFGGLNHLRHHFEVIDDAFRRRPSGFMLPANGARDNFLASNNAVNVARTSRDTQVLRQLLADDRFQIKLLTGHSKGNLVISEALYGLGAGLASGMVAKPDIVTISATVAMPVAYGNVVNVIGGWDWFGGLNSRPDLAVELKMPQAWHHTNTELACHLSVTKAFQRLLEDQLISP